MISSRVGRPTSRRTAFRHRAWIAALAVGVLGLCLVSASGAAPNPTPISAFGPDGAISDLTPLGLSSAQVKVIVQLPADPITVADAKSANGLSAGAKQAIRDQLKAAQAPVTQQIQALGGQVLATYQAAYDGIKVMIAANQAAKLRSIPGVSGVWPVRTYKLDNVHGVPLIGAPQVWDALGGNFHGEGIKIADIDTGIDYTHADFGGSGNPADYQAALASDTLPANPAWFGPNAPKVKGGIDLVGDNYDADPFDKTYQPIPHPDPNPLDCNNHGTHTAGTAAGFGVLSNGQTYTGPYNANTISSHTWNVGPGAAPKADLYSIRVFGCTGSTDVVVDAIEWAVDHNMDVINMSLGAPYGSPNDPDAVASTNAAKDGVIVIASAGNSGSAPYVDGSPATGAGAVSVAATDPTKTYPGATMNFGTGSTLTAIVANGADLPAGTFPVKVIAPTAHDVALGDTGPISFGCSAADDSSAGDVTGAIIVVARGVCARVAKAIFGQQAGAAGVIMLNNSAGFPPFEGKITADPDPPGPPLFGGFNYTVTIPFLGVPLTSANRAALLAANGSTVTLTATTINNPGFEALASFTSWGPASGDSSLKPNVTAPGVSIASAGMGTGTNAIIESGTSMAAPHTTGTAALVRQAHPDWKQVKYWEGAIENTADPGMVVGYRTRGAGTGLIQAQNAVKTQVVALGGNGDDASGTVNFGFNELSGDFSRQATIKVTNFGSSPATFAVSDTFPQGRPHTTSFDQSSLTVPGNSEVDLHMTLNVPAATAGGGAEPLQTAFNDVSGLVTLTPAAGSNNGVTLRVPYYMVPQATSNVGVSSSAPGQLAKTGSGTATVTNTGVASGNADWYAWGIKDGPDHGLSSDDINSVGVQSFPSDGVLAFAISTNQRWSNEAMDEFDVLVDTNSDGVPDFDVVTTDWAGLSASGTAGVPVVSVIPLKLDDTGHVVAAGPGHIDFFADAPTDSSTLVAPVLFSRLGLTAAHPRFTYWVQSFGRDGTADITDTTASFNAFSPAVNTGMFDTVAPGGSATESLTVNAAEQAQTPALGWMVVSHDNASRNEANFISLR